MIYFFDEIIPQLDGCAGNVGIRGFPEVGIEPQSRSFSFLLCYCFATKTWFNEFISLFLSEKVY